jgi:5S rRNA maturation endonuclease (ribonuclease M5)
VAKKMFETLNNFKNWKVSESQRRDLKKELYKILSVNDIQNEVMIKTVEKILGHLKKS